MEAMRQSWSDDRLDDLNKRVDEGFTRVDARFAHLEKRVDAGFNRLDAKIDDAVGRLDSKLDRKLDSSTAKLDRKLDGSAAELRREMKMGFDQINARFDTMQQTMIRVGGGLIGVLVASSAGLIATQL
jgi:hypothetical protein